MAFWGYSNYTTAGSTRPGVRFGLVQSVAPGAASGSDTYPVDAADCKTHARIEISDDDTWITSRIIAATEYVESFLSRQLLDATYQYTLPCWPPGRILVLPRPPLDSITSVEYLAVGTTDHTTYTSYASSNWYADTTTDPGRLVINEDADLPDLEDGEVSAVRVTYVAGYGTADTDVPDVFRLAILQLVHQWYERPELMHKELPDTVKHMLWPYRSTFVDVDGWH